MEHKLIADVIEGDSALATGQTQALIQVALDLLFKAAGQPQAEVRA